MPTGPYELVDNNEYGSHKEALNWLGATYPGPFSIATGFVGLGGLDTLARLLELSPRPLRLLLGATPPPGLAAGEKELESEPQVSGQFEESWVFFCLTPSNLV
jgi:hypothetical protein